MSGARLSPADVDRVIAVMRAQDGGEWVSRGRSGEGFAYRGGIFYVVYVDESDRQESPFADEAAFRRHLAGLELSGFSQRYVTWAIESMGVFAWVDVGDAETRAQALADARGVAMLPARRWAGVVSTAAADRFAFAVPGLPPLHVVASPDAVRELAARGLVLPALAGVRVGVLGVLREDRGSGEQIIDLFAASGLTRFGA